MLCSKVKNHPYRMYFWQNDAAKNTTWAWWSLFPSQEKIKLKDASEHVIRIDSKNVWVTSNPGCFTRRVHLKMSEPHIWVTPKRTKSLECSNHTKHWAHDHRCCMGFRFVLLRNMRFYQILRNIFFILPRAKNKNYHKTTKIRC